MANDSYITYPLVADSRDLMQRCFDFMAAMFPGWEPSEGQLDTMILEATSSEAADIATLTTEVPKSVYRYFGAKLMGIPPEDAVAATATTTWFLSDTDGHTIPAGTQVSLTDDQGNQVPFVTLVDVTVLSGSSQTAVGGVTIVAVVPGSDSTGIGLSGSAVGLTDVYSWVDSITQATSSIGGQDAEDDDAYLNRLTRELLTISPRPILPNDFAILARNADPTIQRATAIDGYNPAGNTFNNERMVTVVGLTAAGAGVSAGVKTAMHDYLDALREVNFVVNTADPTTTTVDVTTNVLLEEGFSSTDVQFRVAQAVQQFLSPATWGVDATDDPNDPLSWNNTATVSYLQLATLINNVAGVALIISLTIGLSGGAQTAADHTLTGVAPLPNPGSIIVNITLPT